MNTPILYDPLFTSDPNAVYNELLTTLPWIHAGDSVPRKEYYHNQYGLPYRYGTGEHSREYQSQPLHPIIEHIGERLFESTNVDFDVVFANLYEHQHHHLGWHADDSPEMSHEHPIAIVSFGAEREIWFRQNGSADVHKFLLNNGSACIMLPGMQLTHQHRIPKHPQPCMPRISLTFRKYARNVYDK